ncbi:MAG: restriction endonuclease [Acidobacteria bacterium]|nr:restriction endonuclease [Acidobacteriota bacterium]
MALPTYQSAMLPLLKFAGDRQEHSLRDATRAVSEAFKLTEDERNQLLSSGRKSVIDDRVGWARTYLGQAGLLDSTRRGHFRISERGFNFLSTNPTEVNVQLLKQFPEFAAFLARKSKKKSGIDEPVSPEAIPENESTPEEAFETSFQTIRNSLANEVLEQVKACSPSFFERLVVELLVAMGYGGTLQDAGKAVGKSNDGGIDGIIKEDRLGLDVIYLQAKKWEATVGSPELRGFAGALMGKQATKGVFITTSNFSNGARDYVKSISSNIILIDGEELADLLIDFNVGVNVVANYEIKRIDSDYFVEE